MRRGSVLQFLERWRFGILFACLLILFVIQPLLPRRPDGEEPFAIDAALAGVLLAGLWSLKWRRSAMLAVLFLISATLAAIWSAHSSPNHQVILFALLACRGWPSGSPGRSRARRRTQESPGRAVRQV